MVPKSQKPELLMSLAVVPELPGVPDPLQPTGELPTLGELGFGGMKICIKERFLQAFGVCMELYETLFC